MFIQAVRVSGFRVATVNRPNRQIRVMGTARSALEELGTKGEFIRKESVWRDAIKEGSRFPPEGKVSILRISNRPNVMSGSNAGKRTAL